VNLYTRDPASCTDHADYMGHYCKDTCGLCSPTTCTVEAPAANVDQVGDATSISQGESVTYRCGPGQVYRSGDYVRGCLKSGAMAGEPLDCGVGALVASSDYSLTSSPYGWGNKLPAGLVILGELEGLTIPVSGTLVKWEFYSRAVGDAALMVWRRVGTSLKYKLIGTTPLTTPKDTTATFYLNPDQQYQVQAGDVIGIHTNDPTHGIQYRNCGNAVDPGKKNLKRLVTKIYDRNQFRVGQTKTFKKETKQPCRFYTVRAYVKT